MPGRLLHCVRIDVSIARELLNHRPPIPDLDAAEIRPYLLGDLCGHVPTHVGIERRDIKGRWKLLSPTSKGEKRPQEEERAAASGLEAHILLYLDTCLR